MLISVVMITLGQVIAYGIGAGFANVRGGWRWMVGLGAVPAGIQFLFLFFLPESRTSNSDVHTAPSLTSHFDYSSYFDPERQHTRGTSHYVKDLRVRKTRRS